MLPLLLLLSFFGTCASGLLALLLGKRGQKVASATLILSTGVGAIVAIAGLVRAYATSSTDIHIPFFSTLFSIDALSLPFFALLNCIACIVTWFAIDYVAHHEHLYHLPTLHAFFAFFLFGMQGVLLATTPFVFMLFWEVMSIASFFLVIADREQTSIRAGLFYFTMTHLGAGALLAGYGLLGGGSLVMTFDELSRSAQGLSGNMILIAFALFLFGFGSKAGLWPLHAWLPEAHPQAPSHVSALMSGVMLKIALYGFVRVLLMVLPPLPAVCGIIMIVLGLIGGLYGVLYAIVERDIKRVLAHSSVENIGLLFVFLGTSVLAGSYGLHNLVFLSLAAFLLHGVVHAFFKSGLFLASGAIIDQTHTRSMEAMGGLAQRMGHSSIAVFLLIVTAAALPPFGAFFGEWLFLNELVVTLPSVPPSLAAFFVGILGSLALIGGLAVFAMIKFYAIIFLGEPRTPAAAKAQKPSVIISSTLWILALVASGFGICAPLLLKSIGFRNLVTASNETILPSLLTSTEMLAPIGLLLLVGAAFFLTFLLRKVLVMKPGERRYHTWDCGQPITAGMEYTGTAFSGPIRFFFGPLLRTRKTITATSVHEGNPWIATRTYVLTLGNIWFDWLYAPIARSTLFVSTKIRRIQNGVIQCYIALLLLALVVTLRLAL